MGRWICRVMAVVLQLFCLGMAAHSRPALQKPATINVLLANHQLSTGQSLVEGPYKLLMQADCNLVLYRGGAPIWGSGTNGRGTFCRFVMQNDGDAVIYNSNRLAVFATNTANLGDGTHYITLQCDGNVIMYNNKGSPLWATNTGTDALVIASAAAVNSAVNLVDVADERPMEPIDATKLPPAAGVIFASNQ